MNDIAENIQNAELQPVDGAEVDARKTQLNRDQEVAALGFSTTQPEMLQASRCLNCAYANVPNFKNLPAAEKKSIVNTFMVLEEEEQIDISEFTTNELLDAVSFSALSTEREEEVIATQEHVDRKNVFELLNEAQKKTEKTGLDQITFLEAQFEGQTDVLKHLTRHRQKLESIAGSGINEEENAVLANAVSQVSLNFSGATEQEIYAPILPYIDQAEAAGQLSQETANKVRLSVGVPPKGIDEPLKVASDSKKFGQDLLDRRTEIKEIRDPETGEVIDYEEVVNNDVIEINNGGLRAYLQPINGTEDYKVTIPLKSQLPMEHVVSADRITTNGLTELNAFFSVQAASEAGFTDIYGSEYTDTNVIRDNYEKFIVAAGLDPFDGSMWTSEATDRMIYIMQMIHPRGDWGQGDVNKENWKEYAADKGIFNQDTDQWDYQALRLWRNSATFATIGKDGEALDRSGNNPTLDAPAENSESH